MTINDLKTNDFDFNLPQNLIAQMPLKNRSDSKMLVFNNQITDDISNNLANYLNKEDILVFNDTKVIKAKLDGFRGGAKISVNLNQQIDGLTWHVLVKGAKKIKQGDVFKINDDFQGKFTQKNDDGSAILKFLCQNDQEFHQKLEKYGSIPLPPYIKRNQENPDDLKTYQTIYAKNSGAVAAPTAGLHFNEQLFKKLEQKGIKKAFATLQVGAGTFLPVKSDLIKDHKMHSESFNIDQQTCDLINSAKANKGRVIAIGTTAMRILESTSDENGFLKPKKENTNIFIYPSYKFKIVDGLFTNFHLPKSTLFMLICAFVGTANAKEIYQHAIENKYRFFSYGDSSLLFHAYE